MTRATEIVQALIERAPPRPPLERTTGMPYGWALWLRAMKPLAVLPHAHASEVVELVAQRPVQSIPPGRELATWPAFFSLFQQGWQPPPRDELATRWTSRFGSAVLHVLFVVFLAWMAYLQSLLPPPPPEAGGGGERVEVGFVGAGDPGTPQTEPGQAAAGEAAQAAQPAAQAASTPTSEAVAQSTPEQAQASEQALPTLPPVDIATPEPVVEAPALPEVVEREVPQPLPPNIEQPVQVTEVEQPTIDYVLPPTAPREVSVRTPEQPQVREREVVVVQAPVVQARPVDVQVRQPREAQVRVREVGEPVPPVQMPSLAVPTPRVQVRTPSTAEPTVRQRELAMPSPPAAAPAPVPAAAPAPAPAAVPSTAPSAGTSAAAAPGPGPQAAPAATGRAPGSAPTPAPGASSGWKSPQAGDDWGQARSGQQRPGGAPGLFDSQGRVQLPGEGTGQGPGQGPGAGPGAGVAERGAPGGDNDSWTRDRIDQSGTWLKRPPYDYEPTSFDRYWVPNDSLLADWVRQGMKSVAIPIPGTGKKINCVISILQLGGGCGITDPDLNEQPTTARPPPDVPFKPELQEENGSVKPQP